MIDQQTGRPLGQAQVVLEPSGGGTLTDVSGRYRTNPLDPGFYNLVVRTLGYTPVRVDSVRVDRGETTVQNVALGVQAVELQGLVVTAEGQRSSSSEAGLLAMQKAAPVVTDGISAEQMSRAPDSDAADAIARVTGVAVAEGKFVVVRGLEERYSTTLLNGSELASPEPTQRVVPLDIFPASLLDAVVTTKAATPDKPGEFAGGLVEIRTKDFPEEEVFEVKLSTGINTNSTFRRLPIPGRRGEDFLAFDGARRHPPTPIPDAGDERVMESLRWVWTPTDRFVYPDLGFGVNYGNQIGPPSRALGFVLSFDYGISSSFDDDDYYRFTDGTATDPTIAEDDIGYSSPAGTGTDWGLLANASLRLGSANTLSLRNLVTREAEEFFTIRNGYDISVAGATNDVRSYQARYIERSFLQSQVSGKHMLGYLFDSVLDWSGGISLASRDEPENRSLHYYRLPGGSEYTLLQSEDGSAHFRYLDDQFLTGQLDWSVPFLLWGEVDQLFKIGTLARFQKREYDSQLVLLRFGGTGSALDREAVGKLPPEQATQPEHLGRLIIFPTAGQGVNPYVAENDVLAGYAMLDLPIGSWLRLVGGVRMEKWDLGLDVEDPLRGDTTIVRQVTDILPSVNLTLSVNEAMNLRLAGYRTVSRPDPREVSLACYSAVVREGATCGNPELDRATILNGDARWEWYPNPGELISIGGFWKELDQPIVETVGVESGNVLYRPVNAISGRTIGAEVEVRTGLGLLPGPLGNLFLGANFTYALGSIDLESLGSVVGDLPMQHLSDYLFNGSLSYENRESGLSASILYNHFSDRMTRYGQIVRLQNGGQDVVIDTPDMLEVGRGTLDAKIGKRFPGGFSISFSGTNLTRNAIEEVQVLESGLRVPVGHANPGTSFSMSIGYAFR